MKLKVAAVLLLTVSLAGSVFAGDRDHDRDRNNRVPQLDHVFVIMMENHGFNQIFNNPSAPFINQYAKSANLATNYYGVAHPSLTNYLEVVGGSNFNVLNDHSPDWHNAICTPNIVSGSTSFDTGAFPAVCPISGVGTDAATPVLDYTNEAADAQHPVVEIDGDPAHVISPKKTVGETIADQLVAAGRSWKSYQESLPNGVVDNVNYADGFFSNLTDLTKFPTITSNDIVQAYAVKHNPFVYFQSVQENTQPGLGLSQVVDFDGANGLYADLATGRVPDYSFIAPNQCNDQHGRGNGGNTCLYDATDDGSQSGLNPALIYRGDVLVQKIVNAIHASPVWRRGRAAIIVTWDENDFSAYPNTNKVVTIVDTNYGPHGLTSNNFYTHYSLLRTIEDGFRLPCLNRACDESPMSDLFTAGH
jgi:hypothetical protein